GSLIYGQRDFSGLHYRRNRFYDAEQGRFTQEDPIGMAGGINLYGFANTPRGDGRCPACVMRASGAGGARASSVAPAPHS
ncbi:MAG TPA: RHS repeat-associated core domain-containing protein, partial [Longimicrobium sp.]